MTHIWEMPNYKNCVAISKAMHELRPSVDSLHGLKKNDHINKILINTAIDSVDKLYTSLRHEFKKEGCHPTYLYTNVE